MTGSADDRRELNPEEWPVEVRDVSPAQAEDFLATMIASRRSPAYLSDLYVGLMEAGSWAEAAGRFPVAVLKTGQMISGQTVMRAIVRTGLTVPVTIRQEPTRRPYPGK